MIRKFKFNIDQLLSFAAVVVLLLAAVDINAMEGTQLTKSANDFLTTKISKPTQITIF